MDVNLPLNRVSAGLIKLRSRCGSSANVGVPGGRDQREVSVSQGPPRTEALAKGTFSLSGGPREESSPVAKSLTNINLRDGSRGLCIMVHKVGGRTMNQWVT